MLLFSPVEAAHGSPHHDRLSTTHPPGAVLGPVSMLAGFTIATTSYVNYMQHGYFTTSTASRLMLISHIIHWIGKKIVLTFLFLFFLLLYREA